MPRSFHHYLYIFFPGPLRQFSQAHQFFNLTHIRTVRKTAWAAGISQRDGHVIFPADIQNFIVIFIEGVFLTCHAHPRKYQGTAAGYNIHFPFVLLNLFNGLSGNSTVQGYKIHPVFGMKSYHIHKIFRGKSCQIPLIVNHRIIYRHGTNHGRAFRSELSAERNGISVRGQVHNGMSPHMHRLHDFFHFHVVVFTVPRHPKVDIYLGAQHGAHTFRINTGMVLIGTDCHFSLSHQRHQFFYGHPLFFSHLFQFFCYNSPAGCFHLCCKFSHIFPP